MVSSCSVRGSVIAAYSPARMLRSTLRNTKADRRRAQSGSAFIIGPTIVKIGGPLRFALFALDSSKKLTHHPDCEMAGAIVRKIDPPSRPRDGGCDHKYEWHTFPGNATWLLAELYARCASICEGFRTTHIDGTPSSEISRRTIIIRVWKCPHDKARNFTQVQ